MLSGMSQLKAIPHFIVGEVCDRWHHIHGPYRGYRILYENGQFDNAVRGSECGVVAALKTSVPWRVKCFF